MRNAERMPGNRVFRGIRGGAAAALVFFAGLSAAAAEDLQFWARAANEAINQRLVDAWNASHEPKVKLTVFPDDQFVAKIASATAAGSAPDVVAVDLILMPRFIRDGVVMDITDRVAALSFKANLSPGHMAISTSSDGRIFAVPRDVDASLLFWNKDLFAKAGLDPEKAPASWADVAAAAKKISALGGDVSGYYFAGNCAGCNAYTLLPLVWASGGTVLDKDGAPTLDSPQVAEALEFYRSLVADGVVSGGARADNGSNWLTGFIAGNVGIQPLGTFAINPVMAGNPKLNFGVGFLPGKDGGTSAFAGGDVVGLSAAAKQPDAGWEFIAWTLSDEAQLEVVAKNNGLVARTDLIENSYAKANPNLVKGNQALSIAQVPSSVAYHSMFNDPNGPFATALTGVIFDGNQTALADAQATARQLYDSEK